MKDARFGPTKMLAFVTTAVKRSRHKLDVSNKLWDVISSCDLRPQMPAYHAYPPSGDAEPRPLPKCLRSSVAVRRVMYFTLL